MESQSQEQQRAPSSDDKYRIAMEVDAACKSDGAIKKAQAFITNMRAAFGPENVRPYEHLIVLDVLQIAHYVGQGALAKRDGFKLEDLEPTDEERAMFTEKHGDIEDAYDKALAELEIAAPGGAGLTQALEMLKEMMPGVKINQTVLRGDPRKPEQREKMEAQLRENGYSEDDIKETLDGFAQEADKRDRGEGDPLGSVSIRTGKVTKPNIGVPDNGHADGSPS